MKVFTTIIKKLENHPRLQFALQTAGFYVLLMVLFFVLHDGKSLFRPQIRIFTVLITGIQVKDHRSCLHEEVVFYLDPALQ